MGAENETHVYDEAQVRQDCFSASIQHFADQVRSGEPFWTSASDQLESLRVMEDAYRLAGKAPRLAPGRLPPEPPPTIRGFGL
jgi:predicted dehydrogenase